MKNIFHYEKYFFLLLVVLHLLPVLLLEFFVTHDGPAHVYNSFIISRLLHGDELTSQYLMFNSQAVPNWLGHFLLCFFNLFFSGNISERILIGIYIIALPYSFRYFLRIANADSAWASWMIFPFIYSLYLYQGLFNFFLAIPVLFFALGYFLKDPGRFSLKRFLAMTFFGLTLYFCHIFSVILFGMIAGIYLITEFLFNKKENAAGNFSSAFFRQSGFLFLTLIVSILLSIQFVLNNAGLNETGPEPTLSDRFMFLMVGRPLITLNYEEEKVFSVTIASVFWIILFMTLFSRIKQVQYFRADFLFVAALIILLIYFLVPDTLASGSFVSLRLLVFFYLFAIAWIATNAISTGMKYFSMAVFSMLSLCVLIYHYSESERIDREAGEYFSTSEYISENSVVLPISYSANWLHSNLSNYLGADKNIILLDNYEAAMTHFPTQWKKEFNPYTEMNIRYLESPCMEIERYEKITGRNIDFVIRWGFNSSFQDSCAVSVSDYIQKNFTLVFKSMNDKAEVFKRNTI